MRLDLLSSLNQERAARRAAALVTEIGGDQRLVCEQEIDRDPLGARITEQLRTGKSARIEEAGRSYFIEVHVPPPSLVIVGAVHISQSLAPMAQMLGYPATIVDPRTAFAAAERFPNISVCAEWPDQALPKLGLDRWTAFAALTHDPKIDDPAIAAALKANCFYVGALGSKKTHGKRLERLAAAGIGAEQLARIHAPIGLNIGAATPAEIAVSILAEITLRRRRGAKATP
ncbi:MAG TPA: XdhC family protein [Xanthobacteraceae bacterium]|nr:XdhC family protein [Xanthobacteraceae bacterium]